MPIKLDYMEYASDVAAQAAYVSSDTGRDPPSWDLLDEDCSDISDWNDEDEAPAVSEVDPAGQFRFDTNAGAAGNDAARRTRDIGEFPKTFTFEIKLYHDSLGTKDDVDAFYVRLDRPEEVFQLFFCSDGFFIDNNGVWGEVGVNLVKHGGSAEWQTWRLLITHTDTPGDATCDVYLNDSTHIWEKVGTNIPCTRTLAGTDGKIDIAQNGRETNDMVAHIDHIKIVNGLIAPTPHLQSYSEDTIKEQGSYSLKIIAQQTGSLNDTLTKTLAGASKIDLSGRDTLKLWVYASRTGTHISVSIHDSGGTTTTKSIVITSAGTWTEITWDISAVADANKDDINSIIIKITNADALNTFYVDNFYGIAIIAFPISQLNKNRISGYHCFMDQYLRACGAGITPLKLPDGTVF